MLFWGILVYEQSAAALLLEERRGGGTGALCPVPSLVLTACTQETREGFILKHPYVCMCVYCAGILRKEVAALRIKWVC